MKSLVLLLFLGCTVFSRVAEAPKAPDYSTDPDVVALAKVKHFAFGVVAMSGLSPGETLLARILKRDDKIRPLIEVYNRGTPEAKVYALAAFHFLAPDTAVQL